MFVSSANIIIKTMLDTFTKLFLKWGIIVAQEWFPGAHNAVPIKAN